MIIKRIKKKTRTFGYSTNNLNQYTYMYYISSSNVDHLKYLEQNNFQIKRELTTNFLIYDYIDDFLPSRCDLFGYE